MMRSEPGAVSDRVSSETSIALAPTLTRSLPLPVLTLLHCEVARRNLACQTFPMPGQFEVMIERNFSSAHQLRGYKGKCENLHGHNYKIEIYARGSELNNIGLLVDFVELKQAADELLTYLDHKNLNELEPFIEEQNPSAENVARFVLERLALKINDNRVQIYKVRCFETPTSVATYQVD